MTRPLRIEYAGALYHLTARGNARQDNYKDDSDSQMFLDYLARVGGCHQWLCLAYCLMSNNYLRLIETGGPTLFRECDFSMGYTHYYHNQNPARQGNSFKEGITK